QQCTEPKLARLPRGLLALNQSIDRVRELGHVQEARGARAVLAVGRAIMLLEPSFLDQRHQHIGSAHQRSERDDEPGVRANRKAESPAIDEAYCGLRLKP